MSEPRKPKIPSSNVSGANNKNRIARLELALSQADHKIYILDTLIYGLICLSGKTPEEVMTLSLTTQQEEAKKITEELAEKSE
jgi:hypothetical protein